MCLKNPEGCSLTPALSLSGRFERGVAEEGGIRICLPVHCLSARPDRQPYCHTNATFNWLLVAGRPNCARQLLASTLSALARVRKKGSFGKGVFSAKSNCLENLEIFEILENPQTVENEGESVALVRTRIKSARRSCSN